MIPLPLINQIYIVCAAIGSLFLVACALMGAHHGGGVRGHVGGGHAGLGHGGVGGHTGIGHGGAAGHTAIGHSGGAAGHTVAGGHSGLRVGHSGAGGHGGTSGGGHSSTAGSATNNGANELIAQSAQLQASTGPFHAPTREEEKAGPVEAILSALNPTIITTFLAFFGLTGLFFISSFPALSYTTLAPALLGGLIAVKVVTTVMNTFFARMYSSSAATEHDLIGHMAEVTTPIPAGRTGEVTYVVSSKRYASPAKAKSPDQEFKRGTKVIICEHQPDYVLVDLWTDTFIDPAFDDDTLTPQEKLAKLRTESLQ
jgi:membrane protein implicated in regulation of membrane protease activity